MSSDPKLLLRAELEKLIETLVESETPAMLQKSADMADGYQAGLLGAILHIRNRVNELAAGPMWVSHWPTEPGWYWSWREGDVDMCPVQVRKAGGETSPHLVYIRGGHFFYREEQRDRVVWWLPMQVPCHPDASKHDSAH